AEFSDVSHKRGIVSMARSSDPNSAGSQFFIVVSDSTSLDGQYSVFGEVIEGLEIVDLIVSQSKDSNDNPIEKVSMKVSIVRNP
ncbi:MAG: peptidylprolyl isomerase, partial [Nitrososphaerales archaeon]